VPSERFTVVVVLDVPRYAVEVFQRYEERVLPLLRRHDGLLQRRLRTPDGATEVHLLSFASEESWRGYLADPERLAHRATLAGAPVGRRVLEALTDVG
jgi:hypothetical protein